jgi:hypothetical protein
VKLRTIELLMPVSIGAVAVAVDAQLGRAHLADEVAAGHGRLGVDELAGLPLGHRAREHAAAHRARVADVQHEAARVDPGDRRDAVRPQPAQPPALGAGGVVGVVGLAHDRRAGPRPVGLHRLGADPVVADVGVGERDELAGEGGVGHRLLVAAHAGREDDLAHRVDVGADGVAVEAGAVLEEHVGAHDAALTANERSR